MKYTTAWCAAVFIVLLVLGWAVDHRLYTASYFSRSVSGPVQEYRFRSANFTEPVPLSLPFFPREYVRIVSQDQGYFR